MMDIASEFVEYQSRPEIKEQRKGTLGELLGFLGLTAAASKTLAMDIITGGPRKLAEIVNVWREGRVEALRNYFSSGEQSSPEESSPDNETDEGIDQQEAAREGTEAYETTEAEESIDSDEEWDIEIVDLDETEDAEALEEMDIYENFAEIIEPAFERQGQAYMELLEKMNPETIGEMTGEEYREYVQRAIQAHTATVYKLKHFVNDNRGILIRYAKVLKQREVEGDYILGIPPFIAVGYDESADNVFLEYSSPRELHDIFYQGVDFALSSSARQAMASSTAGNVATSAAYLVPVLGTGMDATASYRAFSRGNLREGFSRGGWALAGLVSDALILIPPAGAAARGAMTAARGGRAVTRGARATQATQAARATEAARAAAASTKIKDLSGFSRLTVPFRKIAEARQKAGAALWTSERIPAGVRAGLDRVHRYRWVVFGGMTVAGLGAMGIDVIKGERSGRYIAGEEVTYDSVNTTDMPPEGYDDYLEVEEFSEAYLNRHENPERLVRAYQTLIEKIKSSMGWTQMEYEVTSQNTIRISRASSNEAVTIIEEELTWNLEGMDASYDDPRKAIAMANLLNSMAEMINEEGLTGGEENPFKFSREGDIEFNRQASRRNQRMFDSNDAWLAFYYNQFGITTEELINLFNKWYNERR